MKLKELVDMLQQAVPLVGEEAEVLLPAGIDSGGSPLTVSCGGWAAVPKSTYGNTGGIVLMDEEALSDHLN